MKALVVKAKVSVTPMGLGHRTSYVRYLVIKERDNLAIGIFDGAIVAFFDFFLDRGDCVALGEVEVPNELVEKATALAVAKKNMQESIDIFEKIIESM